MPDTWRNPDHFSLVMKNATGHSSNEETRVEKNS